MCVCVCVCVCVFPSFHSPSFILRQCVLPPSLSHLTHTQKHTHTHTHILRGGRSLVVCPRTSCQLRKEYRTTGPCVWVCVCVCVCACVCMCACVCVCVCVSVHPPTHVCVCDDGGMAAYICLRGACGIINDLILPSCGQ